MTRISAIYGVIRERVDGSVTIMTALMLPMILGMAALSVDYGVWLYQKRQLQMVADIAAMGGVVAIKNGKSTQVSSYAIADAARNGFTASSGNTITVNNPPISGSRSGNNKAVQVTLQKKATSYLSALVLSTPPTLNATSVSESTETNACVITLSSPSGLTLNGGGAINSPNCGVYVNNTSSSSIKLNGGATITTTTVTTAGGISGSGITASGGTSTYASQISDPYASLALPSAGSCTYTNFSSNATQTISPGTYCNGIDLKSKAKVTMQPGTYIISGGSFSVNGQATLTGTGVTIVLTGSSGNYASITMNGGATVTLSAPTSGTYNSILFFGDRNASGVTHTFNGGSSTNFTGVIYTPASDLKFAGNNNSGGTSCTQIVSGSLTVSGTSYFGSGCTGSTSTTVGNTDLKE